jgi:hypothetical protein
MCDGLPEPRENLDFGYHAFFCDEAVYIVTQTSRMPPSQNQPIVMLISLSLIF